MQLLLMRHAQTNYNLAGLCNDDPNVPVHLTTEGAQQATRVADNLRAVRIDAMVVSELPRTRATADIINRHHDVPIVVQPRLNDIRTEFEGRPVSEYFAAVSHDRLNFRPPGGESLRDFQARVLPVLDWLHAQPWNAVLAVTHEEALRVLVAHLRGLPDAAMQDLNFANCAVETFEL